MWQKVRLLAYRLIFAAIIGLILLTVLSKTIDWFTDDERQISDGSNCQFVHGDIRFKVCEDKTIVNGIWTTTQLFWVDDRRVFFRGTPAPRPRVPVDIRRIKFNLYLWTPGHSARIHFTNWQDSSYCADHGVIRYRTRTVTLADGGKAWHDMYGPPGKEVLRIFELGGGKIIPGTFKGGNQRCTYSVRPEMAGKNWSPLSPEHGHVEIGRLDDLYKPNRHGIGVNRPKPNRPFMLYPPDQPEGIKLPIPWSESLCSAGNTIPTSAPICFRPADLARLGNNANNGGKVTVCPIGWCGPTARPDGVACRSVIGPGEVYV